jgi:hypothetical protein
VLPLYATYVAVELRRQLNARIFSPLQFTQGSRENKLAKTFPGYDMRSSLSPLLGSTRNLSRCPAAISAMDLRCPYWRLRISPTGELNDQIRIVALPREAHKT